MTFLALRRRDQSQHKFTQCSLGRLRLIWISPVLAEDGVILKLGEGLVGVPGSRWRYGLPQWQVTTTASEANRAVIRWCRGITGRQKILIFNGCYHGTLEDTMVELHAGQTVARAGLVGQGFDLVEGAVCVEFNAEKVVFECRGDG